ncbi:MAG: dynamin family protein [Wolinella sp.]
MTLLEQFIVAYKENSERNAPSFNKDLLGLIDMLSYTLNNERFLPSNELKDELSNLRKRALEPMKVAIIGQFSAGKSTFLNAILSKPILPTGITPITSKICQLCYGDEFSLKVVLRDGRSEFHKIENLKAIEEDASRDVKELTVYAPTELLKSVTFLDTPGFNSQNSNDTKVTSRILDSVDGIIWLSLIDSAGKQSELEILQKHLKKYASKSLCVLNQKDRIDSPEQIQSVVEYIKGRFGEFFADVIPVSSRLALQAKGFDKGEIAQEELWQLSREITQLSLLRSFDKDKIIALVKEHEARIDGFCAGDSSRAMKLYEESNFKPVLDFINSELMPKSLLLKEFTLKNEMRKIIDILKAQYENFQQIYERLDLILARYASNLDQSLKELKNSHRTELHKISQDIRYHLENIAETLYRHVLKEEREHVKRNKNRLGIEIKSKQTLLVARLDRDRVNEELFLGDSKNMRFFKAIQFKIRRAMERMDSSFLEPLSELKESVKLWQEPHELVRKRHSLGSDSAHSNMRKFAAKSYELIIKDFVSNQNEMTAFIHSELGSLLSLFGGAHEKMLELAILRLEERMESSILRHIKAPMDFPIYHPSFDEILTLLEDSFALQIYLPKIEGESTVADRAYQKMFTLSHSLVDDKRALLSEKIGLMSEQITILDDLLKKINSNDEVDS